MELTFRDAYLARSDLWRLVISELNCKTVYQGQKVIFIGSIKAQVKHVYLRGEKVSSAYFSPNTKPIFRSESARGVLFLQMSKEMWEFDSDGSGEIMFNKVINGFLPELFKRWMKTRARHLISIVLFTRLHYDGPSGGEGPGDRSLSSPSKTGGTYHRDYYRVVVSEMESGQWVAMLRQLKKEFKVFRRDISIHQSPPPPTSPLSESTVGEDLAVPNAPESVILGKPSAAIRGNVLEAICLASSHFPMDHIDRDLIRTGSFIVIVTPGTGYFEVDYNMLKMTNDILTSNGICIDLICLPRMPLHSVPLFKYRNPLADLWTEPATQNTTASGDSTPRQRYPEPGSFSSQHSRLSPSKFLNYDKHLKKIPPTKSGPNEWSYAVPTWIDVSYWAGSSDLTIRQVQADEGLRQAASTRSPSSIGFLPRANMYELQMMGIMENEMSNISLPHLNSNARSVRYPRSSLTVTGHHHQETVDRKPASGDNALRRVDSRHSDIDVSSLFAKVGRDRFCSKEDKDMHKWMDEYDDRVFCSLPQLNLAAQEGLRRKSDTSRPRALDDHLVVLGTSFNDHEQSLGKADPAVGMAYFDRKIKERERNTDSSPSLSGKRKTVYRNPTTPSKAPYQLGSVAGARGSSTLKAVASTELKAEHATSGTTTSHLLHQPPPVSALRVGYLPASLDLLTGPLGARTQGVPELDVPGKGRSQDSSQNTPSRPIPIRKSTLTPERPHSKRPGTISELSGNHIKKVSEKIDVLQAASIIKQAGPKIDPASSAPEFLPTLSPAAALAPWPTLLNPSHPTNIDADTNLQSGRWQHVFPHPRRLSTVKWKSLCSPAVVPLTTDCFPTAQELASDYLENPYTVSQNDDDDLSETPKNKDELIKELIALRLSQGFQLVIGSAVAQTLGTLPSKPIDIFNDNQIAEEGAIIVMSLGNTIHQLQRVGGGEVEIKRYLRKPTAALATASTEDEGTFIYPMRIRTSLSKGYESSQLTIRSPREEYNWNYVDSFIAGYSDSFTEQLRFWCARFVLIPVEQPIAVRSSPHMLHEDNEEEIRIEGIRKLTQMWQRFRHVPHDERRFHGKATADKDTNPLDIAYHTRDPSVVVAAELDNMTLVDAEPNLKRSSLFAEEAFQRANLNLSNLAQAIQGDQGVPMQDRRWHWRLHYNCFIGFEMTTWLLENFRDVHTREEAVELGNELMKNGFFLHVEKRHQFRDGNFFYQIGNEYRNARSEARRGWFGTRRAERSVPSTPASDISKDSPLADRSRAGLRSEGTVMDSEEASLSAGGSKKLRVALSKVMKYDVDHRRRSYRPELINLHYDRLHNPDNCYHLRIDWMNVTAKLIEDVIVTWATTAEKFGLRLVEVPIGEASSISATHPLRSPYMIRLAKPPPSRQPQYFFDAESLGPRTRTDPRFYHKALLRKFGFVLDVEAATNFPSDVEVTYSWGKPDYRYSQYIHRSGVLLAQITDDGDFLLLDNRLCNNRSAINTEKFDQGQARDRLSGPHLSPFSSPLVRATTDMAALRWTDAVPSSSPATPEDVKDKLEQLCANADALQTFYDAALSATPSPVPTTTALDSSIPSLGLPPSAVARVVSMSPPPISGEVGESGDDAHRRGSQPSIRERSGEDA